MFRIENHQSYFEKSDRDESEAWQQAESWTNVPIFLQQTILGYSTVQYRNSTP